MVNGSPSEPFGLIWGLLGFPSARAVNRSGTFFNLH